MNQPPELKINQTQTSQGWYVESVWHGPYSYEVAEFMVEKHRKSVDAFMRDLKEAQELDRRRLIVNLLLVLLFIGSLFLIPLWFAGSSFILGGIVGVRPKMAPLIIPLYLLVCSFVWNPPS